MKHIHHDDPMLDAYEERVLEDDEPNPKCPDCGCQVNTPDIVCKCLCHDIAMGIT